MPEITQPSSSNLYWIFVRQPDDVIGMVAFGIYHADEIDFVEQKFRDTDDGKVIEYELDIFRAIATAQVESYYRASAEALVKQFYVHSKPPDLTAQALKERIAIIRAHVHGAEIGQAIMETFVLLDKLELPSGRQQELSMIASNYEFIQKTARKGVITFEETRIGHAVAADGVLTILDEIVAELAQK